MLAPGSVAIVVKDAKRAMKWYKEKLGFEVRDQDGHWVTVAPKGADVEFHLCEGEPLEPGNSGIAFLTSDVEKAEKELRSKGVKITTRTTEEDWGSYCQFADLDGNEFWVSEQEETTRRTPTAGATARRAATARGTSKARATRGTTRSTTKRRATPTRRTAKTRGTVPVARKGGATRKGTRGVKQKRR